MRLLRFIFSQTLFIFASFFDSSISMKYRFFFRPFCLYFSELYGFLSRPFPQFVFTFFFIFFTVRFYFSDENLKKSYRSISQLDEKIKESEKHLIMLNNNTDNIIEFVEYKNDKKIKKFSFWELIYNDE